MEAGGAVKAVEIECCNAAWWGDRWKYEWPHSIETRLTADSHGLPNAPVSIYVLTDDARDAVKLLRLAADMLERNPEICEASRESLLPVLADAEAPI